MIEDPAIMMVTDGGLAVLGSSLAHHRLTGAGERPEELGGRAAESAT